MSACPSDSTTFLPVDAGSTPTATVSVPVIASTGRALGSLKYWARNVKWYTPGFVNAQLMCVWASIGSVVRSPSKPFDESSPSALLKTLWGCPKVPVTKPCAPPGPSASTRAISTADERVAPGFVPCTRSPSHTVSSEWFSTKGMISAEYPLASSASAMCVALRGRFASIERMSDCSSSIR